MGKMVLATLAALALLSVPPSVSAQARTEQRADSPSPRYSIPCSEMPGGNQLRLVCPTPAFLPVADEDDDDSGEQPIPIVLKLPEGTALRIAIDARTRISHVGETVKGYVVETVYAFDEPVIPEGSVVTGRVTQIAPVPKLRLAQEYANGNFSPFHQYQVTFDHLRLPDGREIEIATTVAPGAAEVVHLVSKPPKDNDAEKEHKKRRGKGHGCDKAAGKSRRAGSK